MRTPRPWEAVLLAAASYRLWRLAAEDKITEGLRDRAIIHGPDWMSELIECPWCLGMWISGGVWLGWLARPEATLALCAPLAISAAVGELGGRAELRADIEDAVRYTSGKGGD